ncbi:TIR domain-containing protein [Xylanibacter ruminicola]|nr:TIR domain-containing protein [Xylanibacter ruminicola]
MEKVYICGKKYQDNRKMEKESRTYKYNASSVTIKFGDITKSTSEVIVSSDDTLLTMSGGVSMAISHAGGKNIQEDAQKQLPATIGNVVVSCAGELSQKHIFHCLTIDDKYLSETWAGLNVPNADKVNNIVRSCIDRCFQLVHALQISSIAFPIIGSGSAHMPYKTVVEIMADELFNQLQKTNRPIEVEVYIYSILDMSAFDIFEIFAFKSAIANFIKEQENNSVEYDRKPIELSQEDLAYYKNPDHEVFISYKREESEKAFAVKDLIEKWGIKTWIDKNGIFSSYDFKEVIEKAIENTRVVIFMSSEQANKSVYVKNEVKYAITCKKNIIPIMLDHSPFGDGLRMDLVNVNQIDYSIQPEFEKELKTSLDYILRTQ